MLACVWRAASWVKSGRYFVIPALSLTMNCHNRCMLYPLRFAIQGFPTLVFFPAKGSPIPYSGARETDDMLKFVHENATKKFDLPSSSDEETPEAPKDEL